jgi:hypothetical protein
MNPSMSENIAIGFQAYIVGRDDEFGAVRAVAPDHSWVTIYVENAGDFTVSTDAVVKIAFGKVTFDGNKLDIKLRRAIGHAHDKEDS